jgi:hypothetical protein
MFARPQFPQTHTPAGSKEMMSSICIATIIVLAGVGIVRVHRAADGGRSRGHQAATCQDIVPPRATTH